MLKSNISDNLIKLVALLIIGFVSLQYINIIFSNIENVPKASDDVNYIFYKMYRDVFLKPSAESIFSHFLMSGDPHQKLDAKLVSYLSYLISGEINFKFLLGFGHALYILGFVFLVKLFRPVNWLVIAGAACIYFIPSWPIYQWTVAIWGYNTYIFYCITLAYLLQTKRNVLAIILTLFTIFSLGSGFLILLIWILYSISKYFEDKSKPRLLHVIYTVLFLLAAVAFTYLRFDPGASDQTSNTLSASSFVHLLNFTTLFLTRLIKIYESLSSQLIFSYSFLFIGLLLILLRFKKIDNKTALGIGILLVIILNGAISGYTRADLSLAIPEPPVRYEIFSFSFISVLVLTIAHLYSLLDTRKLKVILPSILITSLGLWLNMKHSEVAQIKIEHTRNIILDNFKSSLSQNKKQKKNYNLETYINEGFYRIPKLNELQEGIQIDPLDLSQIEPDSNWVIDPLSEGISPHGVLLSGTMYNPQVDEKNAEVIIRFRSTNRNQPDLYYSAVVEDKVDIINYRFERKKLSKQREIDTGYSFFIDNSQFDIENNEYNIAMFIKHDSKIVKKKKVGILSSVPEDE